MTDSKIMESSGLFDMRQASEYLNIKISTLYALCFKGRVRVVKIGKLNSV